MAETRTTRVALPQWSAGTDSPSRADFNEAFIKLEAAVALYLAGTLAALPTASSLNTGTLYEITSGPSAGAIYWSNGTSWREIIPASPNDDGVATAMMLMGA